MKKSKEGCGPPFFITGKRDPLHQVCTEHDRAYDAARGDDGRYDSEALERADIAFLNRAWSITTHSVISRLHAALYLGLMTPWRFLRNSFRRFIP